MLDSRETIEFKEKDKKVNQFLFTRGDANDPCFHCVAKRIRASQVEKVKGLRSSNNVRSREEIRLNIVALEANEDDATPERCLYLDKIGDKDLDATGKTVENYQALEAMK